MRLVMMLLACSLAACAAVANRIEPSLAIGVLDFRRHTADGFFISPDPYTLPHSALGIVSVSATPGATKISDPFDGSAWIADTLTADSVMAIAKQLTRDLGGDGLVSFTLRPHQSQTEAPVQVMGWQLTGLAILREASSNRR